MNGLFYLQCLSVSYPELIDSEALEFIARYHVDTTNLLEFDGFDISVRDNSKIVSYLFKHKLLDTKVVKGLSNVKEELEPEYTFFNNVIKEKKLAL